MGKMKLVAQFKHDTKASEVTLSDGRVVKSIQGVSNPDVLVNTRVIRL